LVPLFASMRLVVIKGFGSSSICIFTLQLLYRIEKS
jgi:hypothetical protein